MSRPDALELGDWEDYQSSISQSTLGNSIGHIGLGSHPPLQEHRYGATEQTMHLDGLLQEKRAEEGVKSHGLGHPPSFGSFKGARLNGLASTSSTSSENERPSFDRLPASSSPEISEVYITQRTISTELPCTKSLVNTARLHNLQIPSSTRKSRVPRSANRVLRKEPEVIDLTGCDESDEEAAVNEMLIEGGSRHMGKPSEISTSRGHISVRPTTSAPQPLSLEESLFTPPPPRRRRRTLMDYVAVPRLPKGLTEDDYHPMSEGRIEPPIPSPEWSSDRPSPPRAREISIYDDAPYTPSTKGKGKEREQEVASPAVQARRKRKPRAPTTFGAGIDTAGNALLDAYYAHVVLPLADMDICPPLLPTALIADTRFMFAHVWRNYAARLPFMESGMDNFAPQKRRKWELAPSSPKGTRARRNPRKTVDTEQEKVQSSIAESETSGPSALRELLEDTGGPSTSSRNLQASVPPIFPDVRGPLIDVDTDVDMDRYFNDLGDSPNRSSIPQRDSLHSTRSFHPLTQFTGQSIFNTRADIGSFAIDPVLCAQSEGTDSFLGLPPSPNAAETIHSQKTNPRPASQTELQDHAMGGDFTHIQHSGSPTQTSTWSFNETGSLQQEGDSLTTPLEESPSIAFSTINPSLLGGEQLSEPPREPAKPITPKARPKLPGPIVYVRRPLHSSGFPVASGGKRAVQIKFRDQDLPSTTENNENRAAPATVSKGKGKQKESTPAQSIRGDAEGSADVGKIEMIESSPRAKRAKLPSCRIRISKTSISKVVSDSESDCVLDTSDRLSTSLPPSNAGKSNIRLKLPEVEEIVPEKTSCHQCRNTTTRLKMQCSNKPDGRVCGKRFCQRCILRRYPDITFDQSIAGFMCPVCTNTCNCSFCSRKRGEEFISMRVGDFVGSRTQSKVVFIPDEPESPRKSRTGGSASTAPEIHENRPNFWAHVYGMEGERVGSAFLKPEHAAALSNVPNERPIQPPRPKKPKPPRIFIGHPQKSWKIRSVCDLDPDPLASGDNARSSDKKGKDKAAECRRLRLFIGNPTFLHQSFERMPVSPSSTSSRLSPGFDSDGTLTPLSELEDAYWPQPDVGESCSWQPPAALDAEGSVSVTSGLSDEQVAQAIHVALAAIL